MYYANDCLVGRMSRCHRIASKAAGREALFFCYEFLITFLKLMQALTLIFCHFYRYQDNINKLSAIYRDDPQTPIERVIYWMEFAVRHGGVPHLRSAAHDLNILQFYLVDVIAVMGVICLLVIYMTYRLVLCIIHVYRRRTNIGHRDKKNLKTTKSD